MFLRCIRRNFGIFFAGLRSCLRITLHFERARITRIICTCLSHRRLSLCWVLAVALFVVLLRPVYAVSLEKDFSFLTKFSFTELPWPASLCKNQSLVKPLVQNIPDWMGLWNKARLSARAGDLRQSLSIYRQSLSLKPNLDAASWEMANVLFSLGNYKEALAIVDLLYEHEPNRKDYMNGLAVLDLKVGEFGLAADLLARLHERNPADFNVLAGAVYGYLMIDNLQSALPLCKKLNELVPDTPGLGLVLGTLAYEQGDYDTAAKQFSILALDDTAPSHLILFAARSLDHLGQAVQAEVYWQRLLVTDPDMVEAHSWLAHYFESEGKVDKALPHLLVLNQHKPDDASLLKRLGRCYVGLKKFPQALKYFQKYLLINPDDIEATRFVVNLQAALGNKDETLSSLEHYFDIVSHPDKANLEKAAKLYGEKGLFRQAIAVWRQLLEMTPDDPEILGAMAHNFLAIGQNEEALKVWKKMASISPNVIEVYRTMADLLEDMGRTQELIEVLEAIRELNPQDQKVNLKLTALYMRKQEYDLAGRLLDVLATSGCQQPDFFYWRARYVEEQGDLLLALRDFEDFLRVMPDRRDVQRRCMVIAGRLGRARVVKEYYDKLRAVAPLSEDMRLTAAVAWKNCGNYDAAKRIFLDLLNVALDDPATILAPDVRQRALRASGYLAALYQAEGESYEAEQALRLGMLASGNYAELLPKLFDLALVDGQLLAAGDWLELMRKQGGIDPWYVRLREARLCYARGNTRQTGRLVHSLVEKLPELQDDDSGGNLDWPLKRLDLADLLRDFNPFQAKSLCKAVLAREPKNVRAMVIMASLRLVSRDSMLADIRHLSPVQLLDYARLAQKDKQIWLMERSAHMVLDKIPDSLTAAIIEVQALTLRGKFSRAVKGWEMLAISYPGNSFVAAQGAKAAFSIGDLDKAIALSQKTAGQGPGMILLRARILWMQNDLPGSVKLYEQFLTPEVDGLLGAQAKELGVALPVPVQKNIFYRRISLLSVGKEDTSADLLMAVQDSLPRQETLAKRAFRIAVARHFALYRWQNKFAAELLVRRSVQRRAYFMAQRLYESLIAQYPADQSLLFDLAGIYSQLGKLDDEAEIYDRLQAASIKYKGLSGDVRRNRLKRRPRASASVNYAEEEGRNDYKDMRITSEHLALRVSPATGQEFKLQLVRKNYHGVNADGKVRSVRALAFYDTKILDRLTVNLGAGVESLDQAGTNTVLFNLQVAGKVSDQLSAKMSFKQEVVSDTIDSVKRGIYKQNLLGGVSFAPFARLSLGSDYNHVRYSDSNWTTGYDLWSSLLVHSEPLLVQIKYKYDFRDSKDGTGTGAAKVSSLNQDLHPYWAPKNYWTNEVGVYLKHLLSHEDLGRGSSRYYILEYYLGHDADGYAFQNAKGSLCLEFSPHFMARARVQLFSSAVYRKKELGLSVMYRW